MTTLTVAVDPWAHPLEPVHASVLSLADGAPLLSLGAPDDQAAVWYPASWITDVSGLALPSLLDDAATRWGVGRHAAAALAFKGYAWAATLPVVAGWTLHRRVPLLESARLRIGLSEWLPHVRLDLSGVRVAVLPDDPVAAHPNAVRVPDAAALLDAVRTALMTGHLPEVVGAALHDATRVGTRVLWDRSPKPWRSQCCTSRPATWRAPPSTCSRHWARLWPSSSTCRTAPPGRPSAAVPVVCGSPGNPAGASTARPAASSGDPAPAGPDSAAPERCARPVPSYP